MVNDAGVLCSFVIVSYNCLEELKACINSLKKFAPGCEIIVVDNASVDGTPEFLRSCSDIVYLLSEKNLGFSAGCNLGLQKSCSDIVCFLNPDTVLLNSEWTAATDFIKKHEEYFIAPYILDKDGSPASARLDYPDYLTFWKELLFLPYFFKSPNVAGGKFAVSGCCIMGSKNQFLRLNGFDEGMFWCEDVDLCKRHLDTGGKFKIWNGWKIIHAGGKSASKNPHISIPNQIISKFRYFKKHKQKLNFFVSVMPAYINIILRIFLYFFFGLINKTYWKKSYAYLLAFKKLTEFLIKGSTPILP
jgi:GT2 family glycosyltransferase